MQQWMLTILFLSLLVSTVQAQFAGGSGTEEDPYLIATAEHLDEVRNHLDAHFRQIADIDLGVSPWNEEQGWEPIGTRAQLYNPFSGSFDGNGFIIANLTFNDRPTAGLFGYTQNANLKNIFLNKVKVLYTYTNMYGNIGGLVGEAKNNSNITNCSVTGEISGYAHIGCLVGRNRGGNISNSYADCNVSGLNLIGGIAGSSGGSIEKSYSSGNVKGSRWTGGLVGENYGSIISSYSMSKVEGSSYAGGIAGTSVGNITNSYATGQVDGATYVGGLIGAYGQDNTSNSYWNIQTTGQDSSEGGEARTTSQMTHPHATNTYVDWDFNNTWSADINHEINDGYPYLQWKNNPINQVEILSVKTPDKEVEPDELISIEVEIQNTGSTIREFWVAISFYNDESGEWPDGWLDAIPVVTDTLKPGQNEKINLEYIVPAWLSESEYQAYINVWHGYDPKLDPLDPGQMIEPRFAKWDEPGFSVRESDIVDPYSIAAYDKIGLLSKIPKLHRRNLSDLESMNEGLLKSDDQKKLDASDKKIVFLIHGWNAFQASSTTYDVIQEPWGALRKNMIEKLPDDWALVSHSWINDADLPLYPIKSSLFIPPISLFKPKINKITQPVPHLSLIDVLQIWGEYQASRAAMRAYQHGLMITKKLDKQGLLSDLEKVQIVAHSAGTWAAIALAQGLATQGGSKLEIQVIYCDPFIPSQTIYAGLNILSRSRHFNHDKLSETTNYTRTLHDSAIKAQAFYAVDPWTDGDYLFLKSNDATMVTWSWEYPDEGLIKRTDQDFSQAWQGHKGPLWFYAESIETENDEMFRSSNGNLHGWRESLVYQDPEYVHTSSSEVPEIVVLSSPMNQTEGVDISPTLVWEESDRADKYDLQLADNSYFTELIINEVAMEDTEYQLSVDLEKGVTYYWRVRAGNDIGYSDWSDTLSFTTVMPTYVEQKESPEEYTLDQNYPNPFNPSTQIRFAIPEQTHVRLEVYNALGQRVVTLVNESRSAGRYEVTFDATDLSSGIYLYRMQTESHTESRQMMLVK